MIEFKVSRVDKGEIGHIFDIGDLEFVFNGERISTSSDSRLLNMVYVSAVQLIDCLDKLRKGAKSCKFLATDSSFALLFEQKKEKIFIFFGEKKFGPFSLDEILTAVDVGIGKFVAEPLNNLSPNGSMNGDFNDSRRELKEILNREN